MAILSFPAVLRPLPLLALPLLAACAGGEAQADTAAPASTSAGDGAGAGAAPRAGQWVGVIENGFTGDSLLFTVASGGREVRDVEFRGHWRCGSSPSSKTTKRMDVGHVPGAFAVGADGAFAEQKKEPYLLWTVGGRFTGDAAASGTVRIEYDTECDTYELRWRAAPAGR